MRGRGELERSVAAAVKSALEHPGDILVFLPGVGEIRRTAGLLSEEAQLRGVQVLPLHGNLSAEQQDRAIRCGCQTASCAAECFCTHA
jgi:ATP-dependent helicase HrpB